MALRILIIGTGLIGASLGLALKSLDSDFDGTVLGWDANPAELAEALRRDAIDEALPSRDAVLAPHAADVYVLAVPVLPILDWTKQLSSVTGPGQLVTDVGSTKREIVRLARGLYGAGRAEFLPSHPMAGKESGGAALAEATLFRGATWLFTPLSKQESALTQRWRKWIDAIGAHSLDIEETEHDRVCAWVSHLPQMLSTALSAVLEETFANIPNGRAQMEAIGGRALRETTRLGASPYSMWRDVAMTNTEPLAATLLALEQRLQHIRENLRTPELREEFRLANEFRSRQKRPGDR